MVGPGPGAAPHAPAAHAHAVCWRECPPTCTTARRTSPGVDKTRIRTIVAPVPKPAAPNDVFAGQDGMGLPARSEGKLAGEYSGARGRRLAFRIRPSPSRSRRRPGERPAPSRNRPMPRPRPQILNQDQPTPRQKPPIARPEPPVPQREQPIPRRERPILRESAPSVSRSGQTPRERPAPPPEKPTPGDLEREYHARNRADRKDSKSKDQDSQQQEPKKEKPPAATSERRDAAGPEPLSLARPDDEREGHLADASATGRGSLLSRDRAGGAAPRSRRPASSRLLAPSAPRIAAISGVGGDPRGTPPPISPMTSKRVMAMRSFRPGFSPIAEPRVAMGQAHAARRGSQGQRDGPVAGQQRGIGLKSRDDPGRIQEGVPMPPIARSPRHRPRSRWRGGRIPAGIAARHPS